MSINSLESSSSMTNTSENYYREHLIFALLSAPLTLIALYIFITQVVFCCMKASPCRSQQYQIARTGSCRSFNENSSIRFSSLLNFMTACGAFGAFLESAVDFRYTFGKDNDFGCQLSLKFKVSCHVIALLSVYLVFWLRQRILYQHQGMKHLSTKFLRFISWAMSAVIVCGVAISTVTFIYGGRYRGSPDGCVLLIGPLLEIRWIISMVCTATFHICLLILFIHPLMKHSSRVKRNSICKSENMLIPLVQRATVASVLCVLSDTTSALFVMLYKENIIIVSAYVCDVSTVFNVFCMIFSFPDWKTRLTPWRLNKEEVSYA